MLWGTLRKFGFIISLFFLSNCKANSADIDIVKEPTDRIIKFSGFEWIVRTNKDVKQGPGPNYFSDAEENVWLDKQGKLHLKITQQGGIWYCAGLTARQSLGYGSYTFYINSDLTNLDPNVVAGLFTYLTDSEEIDIEFSKWSDPLNFNAQFAVQPADKSGNKMRFDIPKQSGTTIHVFEWKENYIDFFSGYIKDELIVPLKTWRYVGLDIPKAKEEKLKINLWLFKGQIPSDLKEQELVIDSVSFKK